MSPPLFSLSALCLSQDIKRQIRFRRRARQGVAEIGSQRLADLSRPPQPQLVRHKEEENDLEAESVLTGPMDRSNMQIMDHCIRQSNVVHVEAIYVIKEDCMMRPVCPIWWQEAQVLGIRYSRPVI